jgi:hypothetical protein
MVSTDCTERDIGESLRNARCATLFRRIDSMESGCASNWTRHLRPIKRTDVYTFQCKSAWGLDADRRDKWLNLFG